MHQTDVLLNFDKFLADLVVLEILVHFWNIFGFNPVELWKELKLLQLLFEVENDELILIFGEKIVAFVEVLNYIAVGFVVHELQVDEVVIGLSSKVLPLVDKLFDVVLVGVLVANEHLVF